MAEDLARKPVRMPGRWPALLLAVAVHLVFIGVLIFSLRWQNKKPEPVSALLYAPPSKSTVVEPTAPTPPEPRPERAAEPRPEPPAPPVPPKIQPKVEPKAEPKVEPKPDPRAAAIAEKARKDEIDRKKREADAREKKEREKKEADQREAEKKRDEQQRAAEARERQKREEQQRLAEVRERQKCEVDALKAQAEREQAARATQAAQEADALARSRAEADYIRRIQSKVRGNVTLPPDMTGNPEAIFDVVQLPTGEIIDAVLRKSSGSRAYDDAVARAIVKSSPLPRPDRPELFQRTLTLKFRPQD